MKFFSYLYNKTILWSQHRHAPYYLAGVSFAESSFFPIPPDVMLLSMGLAHPDRAWRNAFIATLFSVVGGLFGYVIGHFGIELMKPYLEVMGLSQSYQQVVSWFQQYGIWIIFIAGFSPIPYKLFTVAAGALSMAVLPFTLASIVGRGMRFYLVSFILHRYGSKLHQGLQKYMDWIGWGVVILFLILFAVYKLIG